MEPTSTLLSVLKLARTAKYVNRKIVQDEFFPRDADGSVTRDFLRKAAAAGYLRRADATDEYRVQNAPVYLPTEAGCCLLATHTGDMRWLLDCAPSVRSPQDFPHHLGVTRLLIQLQKAFAAQRYATCVRLVTEHDVLNPDAPAAQRIKLYTEVGSSRQGGKIVCIPDCGFLVEVGSYARAYYVEFETGSDGSPSRVAARKAPGYAGLHQTQKFKLHFPQAQDLRVLAVCPNAGWKAALATALRDKPGGELWLCAAREDVTPLTFLHGEIAATPTGEKKPLVKPPPGWTPAVAPAQETGGGAVEGAAS